MGEDGDRAEPLVGDLALGLGVQALPRRVLKAETASRATGTRPSPCGGARGASPRTLRGGRISSRPRPATGPALLRHQSPAGSFPCPSCQDDWWQRGCRQSVNQRLQRGGPGKAVTPGHSGTVTAGRSARPARGTCGEPEQPARNVGAGAVSGRRCRCRCRWRRLDPPPAATLTSPRPDRHRPARASRHFRIPAALRPEWQAGRWQAGALHAVRRPRGGTLNADPAAFPARRCGHRCQAAAASRRQGVTAPGAGGPGARKAGPADVPHRQLFRIPLRIPADTGTPRTRGMRRQYPE